MSDKLAELAKSKRGSDNRGWVSLSTIPNRGQTHGINISETEGTTPVVKNSGHDVPQVEGFPKGKIF